jgi:hypothetical protein
LSICLKTGTDAAYREIVMAVSLESGAVKDGAIIAMPEARCGLSFTVQGLG